MTVKGGMNHFKYLQSTAQGIFFYCITQHKCTTEYSNFKS